MAEKLRDNFKALEPGLLNLYLNSLSWDEAKSWLCSGETCSGLSKRGQLHSTAPHTGATSAPRHTTARGLLWLLLLSSGVIQLLAAELDHSPLLQRSLTVVQPCPCEWGPKPRLWDLPSRSCT